MKKGLLTMAGVLLTVSLVSAGTTVPVLAEEETTLVYGSGDYTRINPAMDEHGEINILIFIVIIVVIIILIRKLVRRVKKKRI